MRPSASVCSATALWLGVAVGAFAVRVAGSQEPNASVHEAAASDLPASSQARNNASISEQLSPYRISGIVIDTVTESPIPNATLMAAPMTTVKPKRGTRRRGQNLPNTATCKSGPDGHFDLSVLAAGGWELTASARGYRTQALDEHDGYSTAVVLNETVPSFAITFRMTPASAIQGFILDEAGEAVRDANVALIYLPPASPGNERRRPLIRSQQMADDRGFYKFGELGPGTYEIRVSAHPWYASTTARSALDNDAGSAQSVNNLANAGSDPLDVVYATVWYPGVTDPETATPIVLHGRETQDANFHLLPVPGTHLHIAGPADSGRKGVDADREATPPSLNTYLTHILPDGTEDEQPSSERMDDHGSVDVASLSPGTYLVHQQSRSNGLPSLSTIQIGAGSPRTVDLTEGVPATIVLIQVDPPEDLESLQISFRDIETGRSIYAERSQGAGLKIRKRINHQNPDVAMQDDHAASPDRTVSLPAGKYEIFLNGVGDVHLASIEAIGATAAGRVVTIGSGTPKLLLHTAHGLGTVTGTVSFHSKPLSGAMVMLIPATLGNPFGMDLPSRDQSNSDGSFEMSGLLPGGYILIAIDHGWELNWSDPSTLRRYLMHGVPLDIKPGSDLKQTIEAQSP